MHHDDAPPPTDRSLRPARPAARRPHRYERLNRQPMWAHIDGRWFVALALARTQDRPGGPWRYQLEYNAAPGSRVTHLYWGQQGLLVPIREDRASA